MRPEPTKQSGSGGDGDGAGPVSALVSAAAAQTAQGGQLLTERTHRKTRALQSEAWTFIFC